MICMKIWQKSLDLISDEEKGWVRAAESGGSTKRNWGSEGVVIGHSACNKHSQISKQHLGAPKWEKCRYPKEGEIVASWTPQSLKTGCWILLDPPFWGIAPEECYSLLPSPFRCAASFPASPTVPCYCSQTRQCFAHWRGCEVLAGERELDFTAFADVLG